MKKELAGFVRNAILNTAISNAEWGIQLNESQVATDYKCFIITTTDSRENGQFWGRQLHAFESIADAMGCNWHIDTNPETRALELWLS